MLAEKPKIFSKTDTASTVDWSKALLVDQYHVTLQGLLAFKGKHAHLPAPGNKVTLLFFYSEGGSGGRGGGGVEGWCTILFLSELTF